MGPRHQSGRVPRHLVPDKSIADRPWLGNNVSEGQEAEGSNDAAAHCICGYPWGTGCGPLGLSHGHPDQQGTGRSPAVTFRRGCAVWRYSDPASRSRYRGLSSRLIAEVADRACRPGAGEAYCAGPQGGGITPSMGPASKLGGGRVLADFLGSRSSQSGRVRSRSLEHRFGSTIFRSPACITLNLLTNSRARRAELEAWLPVDYGRVTGLIFLHESGLTLP